MPRFVRKELLDFFQRVSLGVGQDFVKNHKSVTINLDIGLLTNCLHAGVEELDLDKPDKCDAAVENERAADREGVLEVDVRLGGHEDRDVADGRGDARCGSTDSTI